jgi:hypothetical protein
MQYWQGILDQNSNPMQGVWEMDFDLATSIQVLDLHAIFFMPESAS